MKVSTKWTIPIKNWCICMSQFVIHFGDRLPNYPSFLMGKSYLRDYQFYSEKNHLHKIIYTTSMSSINLPRVNIYAMKKYKDI